MITSTKAVLLRGMQQCMIQYWEMQIMDANIKSQGDKQQESLKKVGNQCHIHSALQIVLWFLGYHTDLYFSSNFWSISDAWDPFMSWEGFSRIQKHSTKTRIVLSKPKQLVTLPPILSYCILAESSGINYLLSVLQCLYL